MYIVLMSYVKYRIIETTKILCGQLTVRFVDNLQFGVQLVSCTPNSKLSTKNLHYFYIATATEKDVTSNTGLLT